MKTRAKFKIGDKVRLTDEYSKPNYEYSFGRVLSPYSNSIRRIGEVKDIVFDGKYNIYYVKFKDSTITYPFYGKYLELCHKPKKKQVIKGKNGVVLEEGTKDSPKYSEGQYVTFTDEIFKDTMLRNVLNKSFNDVIGEKLRHKFNTIDLFKEDLVDGVTKHKIVNVSYDGDKPVYGLEGFGSLYFYENEITLVEPNQENLSIKMCLDALESIVEKGKDIDVELI